MIKQFRQYIILRNLENRTSCAKNIMGCYVNMVGVPCWYMGPGRLRPRLLKRRILLLDQNPWLWRIDSWVRKYERMRFRYVWKSILLDFYKKPFKGSKIEG